ncbi:hypothetical protein OAH18_00810 [bacterium]|nr:hypothetical protein [bacterium]
MDFGAQPETDRIGKLERRITKLTWLTIAQTVLLAVAVCVYVFTVIQSWVFWIFLLAIVGSSAWFMRDKSPRWVKALGRWAKKLMQVQAEHTAVATPTAPENVDSPSSRMAG